MYMTNRQLEPDRDAFDSLAYKDRVTKSFDSSAAEYDRLGVDFFTPMGEALVSTMRLRPGESVLDVGCGRGACMFPAARLVGSTGRVVGIDIAEGMISAVREEITARGLNNFVSAIQMDADDPAEAPGPFDAAVANYSVIFLPGAPDTLSRYVELLKPGGQFGFTSPVFESGTFPFLPPQFTKWIPMEMLEELPEAWRPAALARRFNTWLEDPTRLAKVLTTVGFASATVNDDVVVMRAKSPEAWVDWSHTQGMRLLWTSLNDVRRAELRERLLDGLRPLCSDDGSFTMDVPVRFVQAVTPSNAK